MERYQNNSGGAAGEKGNFQGTSGNSFAAPPSSSLASFASSPAILPTQMGNIGSKRSHMDLELPDGGLRRNRSKTGLELASRYASTGLLVRRGGIGGGASGGGGVQQGGANAEWGSTLQQEELMYNNLQGGGPIIRQQQAFLGGSGLVGGAGGAGQMGIGGMTMMPMGSRDMKMVPNNFARSQLGRMSGSGLRPTATKIERPSATDFVSMMGLERPQQKKQQLPSQLSQQGTNLSSSQSQIPPKEQIPSLSNPSLEMGATRRRFSRKRSSLLSVDEDMGESLGGSSLSIVQSDASEQAIENTNFSKKEAKQEDNTKEDIDVGSFGSFDQGPELKGEDASFEDFDFDSADEDAVNVNNLSDTETKPALISLSNGQNDNNGKDETSFEDYDFDDSDDDKGMSGYDGMDFEPTPLSNEQERLLKETRGTRGANGHAVTSDERGRKHFTGSPNQLPPLAPVSTKEHEKKNANGLLTSTVGSAYGNFQGKACSDAAGRRDGHETPDTASVDGSADGEIGGKEGSPAEASFIASLNRMIKNKKCKSASRRGSDLASDDEAPGDQYAGSPGHQTNILSTGAGEPPNKIGAYTDWISDAILALNNGSPTTPDGDGMLPIHLACIYCPNNKRLVGSILIDNPDTARLSVEQSPNEGSSNGNKSEMISTKDEEQSFASATSTVASSRKKVIPASVVSMLQGSFPLHVALSNVTGEKVTYEVVKLLSLAAPDVLTAGDKTGAVPLSVALQHRVGSQIVRYLLQQSRSSAKIADQKNNYPLHFACAHVDGKKTYSLGIIKLLSDAYPYAIVKENDDGKTPLSLAEELPLAESITSFLKKKISRTAEGYT